jgi:hypothetical protein
MGILHTEIAKAAKTDVEWGTLRSVIVRSKYQIRRGSDLFFISRATG